MIILNTSRVNHHFQQVAHGIHRDVPFASVDLFAGIIAALAASFGRLDTLQEFSNGLLELGTRAEIRYIWVVAGSMTCADGVKTDYADLSVYMAGQDSDQDGFPDEGEEPVLYIPPYTFSIGRRLP